MRRATDNNPKPRLTREERAAKQKESTEAAAVAMQEYQAARVAEREKTDRLRALRLAKGDSKYEKASQRKGSPMLGNK